VTLASIGDGVIVTDAQGRVTFLNGEAERLTGWTSHEAQGHPLTAVFHIINEHTRQPVEDPVEKVLRLGTVVGLANHTILVAKDGREIPIDDSGAPIRQSDGMVQGVVLVFRDFTEQKQAEEALRQSESRYRAIGESIDYGIWVCDPEGRNIYASDSFLKLVGITQQQCSDFGWGDVLHPDDAERTIAAWQECVRTGRTWNIEHRFRGVDGLWHPILDVAYRYATSRDKSPVGRASTSTSRNASAPSSSFPRRTTTPGFHGGRAGRRQLLGRSHLPAHHRQSCGVGPVRGDAAGQLIGIRARCGSTGPTGAVLPRRTANHRRRVAAAKAVAENSVIPPMELEVQLPSGRRWFSDASGARRARQGRRRHRRHRGCHRPQADGGDTRPCGSTAGTVGGTIDSGRGSGECR